MPDPSASHGSATRATWQEQDPILCKCSAWRYGRMSAHRDHVAEYARARLAGYLFDDVWADALGLEPMLGEEATA